MAEQSWLQNLEQMAARRAPQATEYKQPAAPGPQDGSPPFTWKLEVKGQGAQYMPTMPGAGPAPGQAPPQPQRSPQEQQRRRNSAKGLLLAAKRAGIQMPFGKAGRVRPPVDQNAQYAALGNMAMQPQAQGGARQAALGNLLSAVGRGEPQGGGRYA